MKIHNYQNKHLFSIVRLLTKGMPNRITSVKFVLDTCDDKNFGVCEYEDEYPFTAQIEIHMSEKLTTEILINTLTHEIFHAMTDPDINFKMPINDSESCSKVSELTANVCALISTNLYKHYDKINNHISRIFKNK